MNISSVRCQFHYHSFWQEQEQECSEIQNPTTRILNIIEMKYFFHFVLPYFPGAPKTTAVGSCFSDAATAVHLLNLHWERIVFKFWRPAVDLIGSERWKLNSLCMHIKYIAFCTVRSTWCLLQMGICQKPECTLSDWCCTLVELTIYYL